MVAVETPRADTRRRALTPVALVGDIATFAAPSASAPGRTNHIHLDIVTGEIYCECRRCECNPDARPGDCWLSREVRALWRSIRRERRR